MVTLYTFVVNLRTAGLNGFFSFPGPAVDDLACELLVLAQLLGVLVQVHHRLADPGLLQPGIAPTGQGYLIGKRLRHLANNEKPKSMPKKR